MTDWGEGGTPVLTGKSDKTTTGKHATEDSPSCPTQPKAEGGGEEEGGPEMVAA